MLLFVYCENRKRDRVSKWEEKRGYGDRHKASTTLSDSAAQPRRIVVWHEAACQVRGKCRVERGVPSRWKKEGKVTIDAARLAKKEKEEGE